jgi:tetratricopeptide (TPR) repeat protein
MSNHENQPDFIVDEHGNVRKANSQGYSQGSDPTDSANTSSKDAGLERKKSNFRYYLIPIPIGLIGYLITLIFSFASKGSPGTHLNNAYAFMQSGDYSQAIEEYNIVLELDPDSKGAYLNRAIAYLAIGDYNDAILDSNKALEYFPHKASVYLHRGIAYLAIENEDKALADFNEAIRLEPEYADAYYNRGFFHLEHNNYDDSITDFSKAIENTKEIFIDSGTTTDIVIECSRPRIQSYSIKISPFSSDLPMLYVFRGFAFLQITNFENANLDFDKAIQLNPCLSQAYYYRGMTNLSQWNINEAIIDFELIVELNNNPEIVEEVRNILFEIQN